MFSLEKEIRSIQIVFITALIINILLIMMSAFHNIWLWLPFVGVAALCIPKLIKRTYLSFATFDLMLLSVYLLAGGYFFL